MGMFDYLKVPVSMLPETDVPPPGDVFQTKDTPDQYMTVYTITPDGKLVWRPYEMITVPQHERPYPNDTGILGLFGSIKRVEREIEDTQFHGDIEFYISNHPDVGWWEYCARFTDGVLLRITLLEFRAPEGRDRNAEIEAAKRMGKAVPQ